MDMIMKTFPTFYMLIGLPSSGKSTWVNANVAALESGTVVLSTDNIIEQMAKESGTTYNQIWKDSIDAATKINYQNFRDAIRDRKSIIWDQTNLTKKKRKNVLSQLPWEYEKFAVTFDVPLEDIFTRVKERAERTGKNIPKLILINMFETYVKPTLDEGFNKIITL
jgi:predicted kinase